VEFRADLGPEPHELPADAKAVLVWSADAIPPRWDCAGIVTGKGSLAEARQLAVREQPGLDGQPLLAAKIGGASGDLARVVGQARGVTYKDEPVEAPEAASV
jgi:hypothetical protein